MKQLVPPANVTFNAAAKTLTFATTIPSTISHILHVANVTTGTLLFQPQAGALFTGTYASPVLTLACSTAGMADADKLVVFYDDGASNTVIAGSGGTEMSVSTLAADGASATLNRLRVLSLSQAYNGSTMDTLRCGKITVQTDMSGFANTLPMGVYNTSAPAPSNGNAAPLQLDSAANLKVAPQMGADLGALRASSTAYAASLVVKASAGTLLSIIGYNSKVTSQFIQVHNTTSVPADAVAPILTILVPATTNFSFDVPLSGIPCTTGIVVCNSSTGATKTIGSADCYFTAVYR